MSGCLGRKSVLVGKSSGGKSVPLKSEAEVVVQSPTPYKSTHSATEASVARLLLHIQEPVVEIFFHKILSSYHKISRFIVFSLILLGIWVLLGNEQASTKCDLGENTI